MFEGKDISKLPPHEIVALGVSQSPEGRMVFANLSVADNLELGAYRRKDRAQIRKDRAYFGAFGVRGVGYYVKELKRQLRQILGLERRIKVAIVGAGNLGPTVATMPRPQLRTTSATSRSSRGTSSGDRTA